MQQDLRRRAAVDLLRRAARDARDEPAGAQPHAGRPDPALLWSADTLAVGRRGAALEPKTRSCAAALRHLLRRVLFAVLLVVVVSSAALVLVQAGAGRHLSGFDLDPAVAAAERHRLGLDRPFLAQYGLAGRALRLDLGESLKYRRPVRELVAERAGKTALLGATALVLATLSASRRHHHRQPPQRGTALARAISLAFVSVPPLVTSFALLLLAARTGWFPVGGFAAGGAASGWTTISYLALPAIALALPIAASLERLQSQAMHEALAEPSIRAALARGCSSGA